MEPETLAQIGRIPKGTVDAASMARGIRHGEPLLVAMDGMIRYAKAYRKANESNVGDDGVLGPHYESVLRGLRGLLNGNGAVAMERNISTDSKCNGVIEGMYWDACKIAGIDGD